MLVLGIETSCDETGVALYESGSKMLLAEALYSQIKLHAEYGGVVPELASRDHIHKLLPLIDVTLKQGAVSLKDLDGIAYTAGPGLLGALMVGAAVAKSLALAVNIPAIGVHHMEGHLLAPMLEPLAPEFPFVALLVSGGHTQLIKVEGLGMYELLGDTLDDAAGEAFDKTAKLLGLPYPGGKALAELAATGRPRFALPFPLKRQDNLDFSFSGLKTAVRLLVAQERGSQLALTRETAADIAASFEQVMVQSLSRKAVKALRLTGLTRLVVSGGVSANQHLRATLQASASTEGFQVFYPRLQYCTDNGAMIALAGALRLEWGLSDADTSINTRARWPLVSTL